MYVSSLKYLDLTVALPKLSINVFAADVAKRCKFAIFGQVIQFSIQLYAFYCFSFKLKAET